MEMSEGVHLQTYSSGLNRLKGYWKLDPLQKIMTVKYLVRLCTYYHCSNPDREPQPKDTVEAKFQVLTQAYKTARIRLYIAA